MSEQDDPIADAIKNISDGREIDWPALDARIDSESQRAFIAELKIVAAVAALARGSSNSHNTLTETAQLEPSSTPPLVWGPLKILERVGAGSFGEVYRAWDSRLDRQVALKLLRQRSSNPDSLPSSIIEEGRLLARVRHPHVVTVHGAERIADTIGIWTEFIEGRSLADIVATDGPLEPSEVARIGVTLCQALSAVHDAGLLHRDIKPHNVMREPNGRIVLMDFGTGADRAFIHERCAVAGTPLFLAPEVLEGSDATVRSDVYSLGASLYFMVTGRHPVSACTLDELREAHRQPHPATVRDLLPECPQTLSETLERVLSPDPSERYDSPAALEAALQAALHPAQPDGGARTSVRLVAGMLIGLLVAVAAVASSSWTRSPAVGLAFEARDWVLMMPFENRTGDTAYEGTLDAAVQRELTSSRFVNVVGRERIDDALKLMMRKPGEALDVRTAREVALRDGGIRAILNGQLEAHKGRLRLTVRVVDPSTGGEVRSITQEAEEARSFANAARQLSNRVRETLGESPALIQVSNQTLEKVRTPSLEALRLYSASYQMATDATSPTWAGAHELVQKALESDPDFPAARIWHAWTTYNLAPRRPAAESRAAAARALDVIDDASDWERHWIRGSYHYLREEWPEAVREYEALRVLYPEHAWAAVNLFFCYRILQRSAEAVPLTEAMAALRPNDVVATRRAIFALGETGQLGRASSYVERLQRLIRNREQEHAADANLIRFFPIHQAVARRDATTAARHLDQLALNGAAWPMPAAVRQSFLRSLVHANLSLGRLGDAKHAAALMSTEPERRVWLARIAVIKGELAEARQLIEPVSVRGLVDTGAVGNVAHAIGLMVESGSVGKAKREWQAWMRLLSEDARVGGILPSVGSVTTISTHAHLMLAQGHRDEAKRLFREALAGSAEHPAIRYRVALRLAELLVEDGHRKEAAKLLNEALADRYLRMSPAYFPFIPAQLTLADIHRQLGDETAALTLETELSEILAEADVDHPIAREIRLRRSSGLAKRQ